MIDIKTLIESAGLYMTVFPTGESFTWRLLTLKEYQVFRGLREAGTYPPLFLYDMVFGHCYIGDADFINGNMPAGYFPGIGELIMHLSGDSGATGEKDEIEMARMMYPVDSVLEVMKRIVLMAFSSYTPDDIEKWSRPELLRKFTIAEALLVNKGGYERIDTKKIMTADQARTKKNKPVIDMRGENREFNSVMGDANQAHILDRPVAVLAAKQAQTNKLEKRQAQELERAMQRGK